MKRFLSLLLTLTLTMSLCACGGGSIGGDAAGSKYTGTYSTDIHIVSYYNGFGDDAYAGTAKMIINQDGTGKVIVTYAQDVQQYNNLTGVELLFSAKAGDIYSEIDLTWTEVDSCLVVNFSGKEHRPNGKTLDRSGSITFEKKGNLLEMLGGDWFFEKASRTKSFSQ